MSDRSAIEWTDATWNPVTGCTKVSPGCEHCYAETFAERWRGVPGHPFTQGFDLTLHPDRLRQPLRWRRPRRIFVNSMSDLFHQDVPEGFIAEVFAVMAAAPRHTFQVLTKRAARMRALLNARHFRGLVQAAAAALADEGIDITRGDPFQAWPPPNVWLGVSAENQKWAALRIPPLLETPAAVRFLSAEPLLGPIDLKAAVWTMGSQRGHGLTSSFAHAGGCCRRFHGIGWVIAGGESGPHARPAHPHWIRSLRDQCAGADIPFFFKQWGQYLPVPVADAPDRGGITLDADTIAVRVGKKQAGRTLDGRTHDAFPTT